MKHRTVLISINLWFHITNGAATHPMLWHEGHTNGSLVSVVCYQIAISPARAGYVALPQGYHIFIDNYIPSQIKFSSSLNLQPRGVSPDPLAYSQFLTRFKQAISPVTQSETILWHMPCPHYPGYWQPLLVSQPVQAKTHRGRATHPLTP